MVGKNIPFPLELIANAGLTGVPPVVPEPSATTAPLAMSAVLEPRVLTADPDD